MTKREFLDALRRLTGAMPDGEQARLLEYYAQIIDDSMKTGATEADAVAALGDPAALARAFETTDGEHSAAALVPIAPGGALKALRVRVSGADVTVRHEPLTNGAAAQLRFSNPAHFTWRMDGDALEVSQPETDAPKFSLDWLRRMIAAPAQRVTVLLNDALSGALDLESGGGDLKLEGVAFARAQLISSSGDIELKNVACEGGIGIDIRTHSGDIGLSRVQSANLIANTASGDVEGKHLALTGDLRLETASGDIELRDLACGALSVGTSSGDVDLDQSRARTISVRTTNGDVSLSALECDPALSVETASGDMTLDRCVARETRLEAVSGDIELRLAPLPGGYDVSASSVSGNVRLDDGKGGDSPAAERPVVRIHTVSGDISARIAR